MLDVRGEGKEDEASSEDGGNPDLEPMDVEAVAAWPPCDAGKTDERRQHEGPLPAGHEATHKSGHASFGAKRGTCLNIANACKKPRNSSEGIGLHEGEAPTSAADSHRETPRPPRSVRHSEGGQQGGCRSPAPTHGQFRSYPCLH